MGITRGCCGRLELLDRPFEVRVTISLVDGGLGRQLSRMMFRQRHFFALI